MPKPDHDPEDSDRRAVVVENHNHYHGDPAGSLLLAEMVTKLNRILAVQASQGAQLMSIKEDLDAANAKLDEANETTNEIASDIQELVAAAVDASAGSAEAAALKVKAAALADRLRGVADVHTSAPADVPPADEPPAEPA